MLFPGLAVAQTLVVAPSALNGVEGNNFYSFGNGGGILFQEIYGTSQLNGLNAGSTITGMRFRLNGGQPANPVSSATNFDIYLGPSNFPVGSLSDSVLANQGTGTIAVRTGPITFAAGSFPGGSTPNNFGPEISFSTSYVYTGGPLLMTVTTTAASQSLQFDLGTGISDTQYRQVLAYNGTTHTTDVPGAAIVVQFTIAVPEPESIVLLSAAIIAILILSRRFITEKSKLLELRLDDSDAAV